MPIFHYVSHHTYGTTYEFIQSLYYYIHDRRRYIQPNGLEKIFLHKINVQ